MLAVVLIVGLVIGAGIGYFAAPTGEGETITETITVETNPLEGKTVQVGYITSTTANLETAIPLIKEIVEVDVNNFVTKLGYDAEIEYLVDQADGQAAIHLEKVQSFKAMDVNIFVGGPWSSMAQAALSYVNENDMLMISSSSTSPLLAISDDRLFRLCPTDYVQAPAMGEMWQSWGVQAVLVFHRGDSWADGIYNILQGELAKRDIVELERVRYAGEVTEFSSYLQTMDDILGAAIEEYGAERVGVQTMSFAEEVTFVTQSTDYPNCGSVIWMSTENSGRNQRMLDDAGGAQIPIRYFSSLMTPSVSWKWQKLQDEYFAKTATSASFYTATDYDASYCIALGILQTQSWDAGDNAEVWPDVPKSFWGTSGWCDLDENGDRMPGIFDIWGYTNDNSFQSYGIYNGIEIKVTWYDDLLTAEGITRPGPV
jgi:branched-chain amino acid transport system substrate-binding protein